ncbi:hypothetical protein [Streptomyces telluris]|uniref:Uncharacterized protein n=1 Tax=Streptomyces telluris TaxID=2720021 RepID=A0A9X2RMB9_9ACTN|nr:hypothetical protein [Streptomyces telluris]MCQ8769201.1 hypothetical protein [Streptomyces telluris]NJP81303.1 hypothetical protein [Streptomyces telluris]
MAATPLVVMGCAWLIQSDSLLWIAVAVCVLLPALVVAGAMCGPGAGPGTCVAILGFALLLFVGPAMNDYVLDRRGDRQEGVVTSIEGYHKKHGDGRECSVEGTHSGRTHTYEVNDTVGCGEGMERGQRVTLVVDPDGWLTTRLSNAVHGLSTGMAWTCGGLLAAMEASILYGRMRRRRR